MKKLPYNVTQPTLWTYGVDDTDSTEGKRESVKQLRERLQLNGAYVLSNAELVALVLGTASANQRTIHQVQKLFTSYSLPELLIIEFGDFSQTHQLGDTNAAQVLAVLELARRLTRAALDLDSLCKYMIILIRHLYRQSGRLASYMCSKWRLYGSGSSLQV